MFLGQYTFHFFAYYVIEVTLTSNKVILPFLNLSSSPLSFQTLKKAYSWFFCNEYCMNKMNEYKF